jgi:hypothetical protein
MTGVVQAPPLRTCATGHAGVHLPFGQIGLGRYKAGLASTSFGCGFRNGWRKKEKKPRFSGTTARPGTPDFSSRNGASFSRTRSRSCYAMSSRARNYAQSYRARPILWKPTHRLIRDHCSKRVRPLSCFLLPSCARPHHYDCCLRCGCSRRMSCIRLRNYGRHRSFPPE